jgi:hypothetical protein
MSKIITAINVMVSNPDLITNTIKGENATECFFTYDNKHLWSIFKNNAGFYNMAYYPGNQNAEKLAAIPDEFWDEESINCVTYSSKELGVPEAKQSMSELLVVVKEKIFGIDHVLDDIIKSDNPF